MVGINGLKKTFEKGGKTLEDAREKKEMAEDAYQDSVRKVTSPYEQKKSELDVMNRAEEPFDVMNAKQQEAKIAMESAKERSDEAKEKLEVKEMAHEKGNNKTEEIMDDAKSRADRAKSNVEDRQRDFQKAEEFVKSLIEKIESRAKSAEVPSSTSGGEI